MERKMRRFKQQLTEEASVEILRNATAGVLKEIAGGFSRCIMLEMNIERLTGKQSIELVD